MHRGGCSGKKRLQRLFWLEKVSSDDGRIPDGDMVSSVASLSQASGPSATLVTSCIVSVSGSALYCNTTHGKHTEPHARLSLGLLVSSLSVSTLLSPLLSPPPLTSSLLSHFFSSPLLSSPLFSHQVGRSYVGRAMVFPSLMDRRSRRTVWNMAPLETLVPEAQAEANLVSSKSNCSGTCRLEMDIMSFRWLLEVIELPQQSTLNSPKRTEDRWAQIRVCFFCKQI